MSDAETNLRVLALLEEVDREIANDPTLPQAVRRHAKRSLKEMKKL